MTEEIGIKKEENKKLRVSIKTIGCQMNMYDTEVAEGLLAGDGFEIVKEETLNMKNTDKGPKLPLDVFLMNTCSVREHAEERVFGRLGLLGKAKRFNPDLVVGLMGCMVEEHREKLFKRFPQLDLMVGTRNIKDLPRLVNEVRQTRRQTSLIKHEGISIEYTDQIQRKGKYHAWLPVMTGCNKVCTFCIVPMTRGAEVSMPAREVFREASRLVEEGVKCITLLGQNVNSYNGRSTVEGGGWKEKPASTFDLQPSTFPELLQMLCEIEGLERIAFTTSHPHDATEELFRVIAKNPKISRRFHLPLQSGSDRMLKRMKRLHTFAEYKAKIDQMRAIVPDIVVTTDIIAGFSGETEEDHKLSIRALEEIRYNDAYIYKYSVRPGTPAAKLPDDVPLPEKERRNAELLKIQREIANTLHEPWIGRTVEVFIEGLNERDASHLMCRSSQDKTVVIAGPESWTGSFKQVVLKELRNGTFLGVPA